MKQILNSKIIKFFFIILLGVIILNLIFPLNKELYDFKYSKIYYSDDKIPMRMKLSEDEYWRFYITNENIPKLLKDSILTFEDKYFYKHFGVNIFSIFRAFVNNLTNQRRIGASTITMQVVKLVENKKRTYLNKIIEIFRAIQLEIYYSKEEILNMYFNKAPYGGNIEGLRAAGYFYFGKNLDKLTISEIAILTTIPKNPNINRPDKQIDLAKKRDLILDRLLKNGLINDSQYNRAKKEKIISSKHDFLFDVVQYTNKLNNIEKTDIYTTLNYDIQKYIQKYLKEEIKKYKDNDLNNSAAIVIDNKTLEIKAYIGSNDFFDKVNGGQNDGVTMQRSPGSTLKPFVFALALDEGLITPKRTLLDIPMSFNDYVPKNFNDKFTGEISAQEALKKSLNIPVLDLQNQLGDNSLYELLEKVGSVKNLKSNYGLAITVGGIDLSLLELTKLYTIFANEGKYKYTNQRLISKEASYLISEILADGYRQQFNGYWHSSINSKKIAFKTGTSGDAKHLYTIGFTPNYTIGLWFGNFNGKKTTGDLTGINTVSNSLIQIFETIENNNNTWFEKPNTIVKKKVCLDYFNNDKCENIELDDVYNTQKSKCMNLNTQKLKYLNKYKKINTKAIAINSCYTNLKSSNPTIISPIDEKNYVFSQNIPENLRVVKVNCQPYGENDILEVYLNGRIIKNNSYIQLKEGNYELLCMKDQYKFEKVKFNITIQ